MNISDTPLTSEKLIAHWSLFDLLSTLATMLLSLVMLAGAFGRKRQGGEHFAPGEKGSQDNSSAFAGVGTSEHIASGEMRSPDDERTEGETVVKRRRILRIASLAPAIASVILFLLTQDLSNPMAIFDQWSLAFALIAIVNVVLAIASRKKKETPDDDQGQDQGQTTAPATA